MKKVLFIASIFLLASLASAKSISASDIIPAGCKNAVIFLEDRRSGNYNKQEYYYLDDAKEIRESFSNWKKLKRMPLFPYHFDAGFNAVFNFYLIIDGTVQSCLIDGISPDGEMIKLYGYGYEYNREYWNRLKPKLKTAKKEEIICTNAGEYRSKLKEIKKDVRFIFSESRIEEKYDGYFYITTQPISYSKIEKYISKAYPGADFSTGEQISSSKTSTYQYKIIATRDLYEKFDLYPKDEFVEFTDIKLTAYLKE